jgi:chemotaxis protein CheX
MSVAAPTQRPKLDPKLIVPFITSVKQVMQMMCQLDITVERPHAHGPDSPKYDYSGIIGFSGRIVGSVVISFAKDTAVQVVNAFAGAEITPGTPDFADAIGEIANMVAGAAKKDLGAEANITVPNVIMGVAHCVARPSDVPCLVVPCKCAAGTFAVEIAIRSV